MIYRLLVPVLALLVITGAGRAQDIGAWDPTGLYTTRQQLESLLADYEQAARSPAYSDELRARARYEAGLIQARLREGDYQVGDQIALTVEGEAALTGTFQVDPGVVLDLPTIGPVPLRGVLRSELVPHLTQEIGRYIRNPMVRAETMIRLTVLGDVRQPGFLVVPADALLTEVLTQAGGPTASARLTEIRIERGDRRIWDGEPLQQAIIEGRTLDQLSIRAGDRIVVPGQRQGSWWNTIRTIAFSIPAIFGLIQFVSSLN